MGVWTFPASQMGTSHCILTELNALLNVLNCKRLSILNVFTMAKSVGLNDILVVMGMKVFYILM